MQFWSFSFRMGECRSPYAFKIEYDLCSHGTHAIPKFIQNPYKSFDFLGIFGFSVSAWGGVDPPTPVRGGIAYDDDGPERLQRHQLIVLKAPSGTSKPAGGS